MNFLGTLDQDPCTSTGTNLCALHQILEQLLWDADIQSSVTKCLPSMHKLKETKCDKIHKFNS